MTDTSSPAKLLSEKLKAALRTVSQGISPGTDTRPIIWGVTSSGSFVKEMSPEKVIANAQQLMIKSGKIYRQGNSIVCERAGADGPELVTLAVDYRADLNAAAQLSNFFLVGVKGESCESRSFLPQSLVINLLSDAGLWDSLPVIKHYSRRPIFAADFSLCRPGWNESSDILVHADAIEPVPFKPSDKPARGPIDQLPPRLAALLGEFSWRSGSDLVNALAFLLTGLLVNHFVNDPHPGVIVDGNQPGLGKTLLVQVVGQLMDNAEPPRIPLSREEELQKQLGSLIRRSTVSVAFFDNVRGRLDSQTLEQSILSPKLSFRLLGQSVTIERRNDLLWAITSNSATGTSDLINRCIPIRLYYQGDPRNRRFDGNPLRLAKDHRDEILGELAGMVLRWVQDGKPLGKQKHRCDRWAAIIGGILDACGLGERFLENLAEAESEMDQGLEDLAALAEHAVRGSVAGAVVRGAAGSEKAGATCSDWVPIFTSARVMSEQLINKNNRGQSTLVGSFLAAHVDRRVMIETAGASQLAILRCLERGSRKKLYWFEIEDSSCNSMTNGCITDKSADVSTQNAPVPSETIKGAEPAGLESFERLTDSSFPIPSVVESLVGGNGEPSWV